MRTKSISNTKHIFCFMCDSGVSMGFDILKAVENENEKLFLKHFNIHLPKWSGVSEKITPIVFLKVNISLSQK